MNPRHRQHGVTLIEVVAAIALLATVAVLSLGAQNRLMRQWRDADQRQRAAQIADRLLEDWWSRGRSIPMRRQGEVEDHPGWIWQTAVRNEQYLALNGMDVVKLEIYSPQARPQRDEPTLEVELVAPRNRTPAAPPPKKDAGKKA